MVHSGKRLASGSRLLEVVGDTGGVETVSSKVLSSPRVGKGPPARYHRSPFSHGGPMRPRLILASASPRRRQLLAEAGYDFEVDPSDVEEPEPGPGVDPASYAANLAWLKALAVAARRRGRADPRGRHGRTPVDGQILNKPLDRADAERMIRLQEGRRRDSDVLTAASASFAPDRPRFRWAGAVETSVVRFRPASATTNMDRVPRLGPLAEGKAGRRTACRTGTRSSPWLSPARFSNVVGLPMERLEALLRGHPGLTS